MPRPSRAGKPAPGRERRRQASPAGHSQRPAASAIPAAPAGAGRAAAGARGRRRHQRGAGHRPGGRDLGRGRQGARAPDPEQRRCQPARPRARRAPAPLPDFARWGEVERQPMSNIRRTTAEHLSHAWNTIPHVTQFDKADITAMEELRRRVPRAGPAGRRQPHGDGDAGQGAGRRGEAVPAVQCLARSAGQRDHLQEVRATSAWRWTPIAACSSRSSATPTRRTSREIAIDVHQLAEKARERKLTLEEMSGGGITISNLGRHRRHLLHADRQLAGSGDSRRVARHHRAGVASRDVQGSNRPRAS